MRKHAAGALVMLLVVAGSAAAQGLSAKWEELTGPDFVAALQSSKGTCALPFGIIEKHGPSGPLGTDLLNVRYTTGLAAREEYTIIFPEYYVGHPEGVYTGIWWFAKYPNHYQGDAAGATAARGDAGLVRAYRQRDPRHQARRERPEAPEGVLRKGGQADRHEAMSDI